MNRTVPINQLAQIIAGQTGYTEEFCRQFIIEMFKQIGDSIAGVNHVKIKNLGEFVVNDTRTDVLFQPDPALAEAVNEPFSIFEPEELADNYAETSAIEPIATPAEVADLEEPTTEIEATPAEPEATPAEPSPEEAFNIAVEEETSSEPEEETPSEPKENLSPEPEEEPSPEPEEEPSPEPEEVPVGQTVRRFSWLSFIFGIAFGFILGAGPLYWMAYHRTIISTDSVVVPADTVSIPVPTQSIDNPVRETTLDAPDEPEDSVHETPEETLPEKTDVIRSTLADVSRRNFGNFKFWVYIYLENKDKIANPNQVEPGTVVVIPSREKYGIDPSDPASIARADSIANEITNKK